MLVAHSQALVRAGIRGLLEGGQSISVVGEAADGDEAIVLAQRLGPDVVLMDATLPDLDVEAIRQISALAGVRVMMLTAAESDERVFQSLRAGVTAFLVQDTEPAELVRAVRLVARGESLLSPSLTRRLIVELVSRPEVPQPSADELEELTKREREVMALVALGLSNDEIAEQLVVSPATAKTHVSRAMVKLHARDRAQLVVFAYQTGLVRPDGDAQRRRATVLGGHMISKRSISQELERQAVVHMESQHPARDDHRGLAPAALGAASIRTGSLLPAARRGAAGCAAPAGSLRPPARPDQLATTPCRSSSASCSSATSAEPRSWSRRSPTSRASSRIPQSQPAGATVHRLPVPKNPLPARRAA